jgi:hypothetical protein
MSTSPEACEDLARGWPRALGPLRVTNSKTLYEHMLVESSPIADICRCAGIPHSSVQSSTCGDTGPNSEYGLRASIKVIPLPSRRSSADLVEPLGLVVDQVGHDIKSDKVILSLLGLRGIDETDIQHITVSERDALDDTPGLHRLRK